MGNLNVVTRGKGLNRERSDALLGLGEQTLTASPQELLTPGVAFEPGLVKSWLDREPGSVFSDGASGAGAPEDAGKGGQVGWFYRATLSQAAELEAPRARSAALGPRRSRSRSQP